MHIQFLPLFVDPVSGEALELEVESAEADRIISGYLYSSTARYPIIRSVPRFVNPEEPNYARSFGYQWMRWSRVQFESANIGRPMEGHTRAMWERITGRTAQAGSLEGQTVLDMGCGPGRFIEIARQAGARVVGVDYSIAVEVAAEAFANDPAVCICQADVLSLPFRDGVFEGAFSIGVLHHTPAPQQGVEQALKVLRQDGWFALSVYAKNGYYNYPNVQFWRKLFNFTWPVLRQYPPLLYSHLAGYILRPLARIPGLALLIRVPFPFVRLPDARWSVLDTFDSVTPSFQSGHETYEVHQWLKRAGFREVEAADWGPTAVRAQR
jgi:SAM-dependent methyltransferase